MTKFSESKGTTENQRKGGVGESATEVVLKPFAQVSSPIRLSEYAIDYICRLYQKNRPSNKIFFVEVKTATHYIEKWRRQIKRETIGFWLIQFYPVYIVVYDLTNDVCYWISVEDNREAWSKKLEAGAKSISIHVDSSHILRKAWNPNLDFIQKIDQDTIRLNAINGIPQVLYKGGKGIGGVHFFEYPNLGELSDRTRTNFRKTIRLSLHFLIEDELLRKNPKGSRRLCKILIDFDKGHYENFKLMAQIFCQLGDGKKARRYYNSAIRVLRQDHIWDKNRPAGVKSTSELISEIETEKAKIPKTEG